MTSLHQRLWRNGILSILGLSLVLWLSGRWLMQEGLYIQVGGRLAHDAEALLAAVGWTDAGMTLQQKALGGVYAQVRSGHYYVVVDDQGNQLRSRSLWDEDLPMVILAPGEVRNEAIEWQSGQALLLRYAAYRKQGHELTIGVAEDIETVEDAIDRFDMLFLVLTLVAMAIFMWLQHLSIHRALAPLHAVKHQLEQLSQGERSSVEVLAPSEIQPLLETLNHLLGLLNERMQRSRNALGNLAHALKTPLNLIQQDIARLPLESDREALRSALDRIRQIVERELRRARIAGAAMGGERFDPERDLADLVEVMRRLYPKIGIALDIDSGCTLSVYDREDMLELVGNLLDNACKWADDQVAVELKCDPGLNMAVSDNGPGIPRSKVAELLQRGTRLDEQVEGYGLGLSIISEIVASYQGSIDIESEETQGGETRVVVRLP